MSCICDQEIEKVVAEAVLLSPGHLSYQRLHPLQGDTWNQATHLEIVCLIALRVSHRVKQLQCSYSAQDPPSSAVYLCENHFPE